ncbi:MAG: hypothetical protein DYG83_02665 [Candidatus Brocadia sp. AMX2]|nr:MAG: hypothetical protein EDM70_06965 [Candidatus Brocadia sp. AMX2]MBC6931053.1 hypothetical protein [Candidatus Brocadia sp.]MBL1168170.1 hypothetical protein [Candidatus Brocadia sp. AMX1]MCE7865728.1 hypothetical protein [Candidatus Brocadia sp. AMX2]MCQ3916245.1 hypothetical protein [Candidatus Brocadia sp.]
MIRVFFKVFTEKILSFIIHKFSQHRISYWAIQLFAIPCVTHRAKLAGAGNIPVSFIFLLRAVMTEHHPNHPAFTLYLILKNYINYFNKNIQTGN